MPEPIAIATSDLTKLIPQDDLRRGTELFDRRGLAHLARFENKLFCEAKGSDPTPYKVGIELADTLSLQAMKIRCACWASRGRPICKHAAALLVAWARAPESFAVSDAPPAGAPTGEGKKRAVKKGKTDAAEVMRHGVDQVSTLVRELAVTGVAALAADRAKQVRSLGEGLREHGLRRLSARTIDLAALLERAPDPGELHPTPYLELVADLLLTARKIEKHLGGGEPLEDRYVEELVGKTWRKEDRKPIAGLSLLEYAYMSYTTGDGYDVNESRFLDLASGGHYSEKQIIPKFLANRTEEKASFGSFVLRGARGGVYPGFPPFRLALEDTGTHEDLGPPALEELRAKALPDIRAALEAFQEHRKDIFAPARFPVALGVDALLIAGARPRLVDRAGNALHLPEGSAIGESLDRARLVAVLGDIDVDAAFPTLFPLSVLVDGRRGLALRSVAGRLAPTRHARAHLAARRRVFDSGGHPRVPGAGSAWAETARAAGASDAAIALHEVRDEIAGLFAAGLSALSPRAVEPPVARLRELGLEKPAALLAGVPAKADTERADDVVKVFQVLGLALVRLAGATPVDRTRLVEVPGARGVLVREPEAPLAPAEATRALAKGSLHAFEAAVHYARWFESAPAEELLQNILPAWANGAASAHVVRTLAGRGPAALRAAERALAGPHGRTAHVTAIRLLEALGMAEADRILERLANAAIQAVRDGLVAVPGGRLADPSDVAGLRAWAKEALASRRPEGGAVPVDEGLAGAVRKLDAARSEERLAAIGELLVLADVAAIPTLRETHREDGSRDVREAAARALALLADSGSVAVFAGALAARGEDDEDAKVAAHALGELGDTRGAAELVAALADGWKPGVIADALRPLGLVALEPLAEAVERDPALGARKAVETLVDALPMPDLESFLLDRLRRAREAPDLADRAAALLKLAGSRKPVRHAAARAVLALLPEPRSGPAKAAARAAERLLKTRKDEAAS